MDRIIEQIEWSQCILVFVFNLLGGLLEAGKHGPFTAGEMFSGVAVLSDFRKYFLHQDELVRHEREVSCEFARTAIPFDIQNGVCEGE